MLLFGSEWTQPDFQNCMARFHIDSYVLFRKAKVNKKCKTLSQII